jgi:uncharacterized protein (DUF1684 family)
MNIRLFASVLLFLSTTAYSQKKTYEDSVQTFIGNYVQTHEVVKGNDKKSMQFYPVNKNYRVVATVKKATNSQWMKFATSGNTPQVYKVYATLSFLLNGKPCQLNVYQSQDLLSNAAYRDYLFLPFTDATTGQETYEGGRYIDLSVQDVMNGKVVIDFNKAYNPYCAYVSGQYNCPIPPKENALSIGVKAGEKAFGKVH